MDDPAATSADIEVFPVAVDIRLHFVAVLVARTKAVGTGRVSA